MDKKQWVNDCFLCTGVQNMRKRVESAISLFVALFFVLLIVPFISINAKAAGTVDDFVERCYTVTLGRGSDPDGFADWKSQLTNGKAVGVHVAYGFLFSQEYTKKNKSNEDYVTDLYMLFMGREPDEAGFNDWVGQLEAGKSRTEVFAGFANSVEFFNICDEYGITAGYYVVGYDRDKINKVNLFVERLYMTCLFRRGDRDGQKNWVNKLMNREITGAKCAHDFLFSAEYNNFGFDDYLFLYDLYIAMMGREPDEGGFNNWVNAIEHDMTRDELFENFVKSQEFANLCNGYGIDRGDYTATNRGYNPDRLRIVDNNGIVIYVLSDITYSDYEIQLKYEIQNNTSQDLRFYVTDTSINGYMVNGYMSSQQVSPGKKAVVSVSFSNDSLRQIGVHSYRDIKETELEFYAMDNSYSKVWESGVCSYISTPR